MGTGDRDQRVKFTEGLEAQARVEASSCRQRGAGEWAGAGKEGSGQGVSGGRWRWLGRTTEGTEEGALSSTAAAGRPRLGRPGAQSRDLTLQASGLPAAPTLKTRGPFPGSEDPSQLGPWSGSKANRKSRRWARLRLLLCLEKGLGPADLDLWVFPSRGGRGLQASQGHGEVQFRRAARVLGAGLQGYRMHGLPWQMLARWRELGAHATSPWGVATPSVTVPKLQPCPGHLASHSCPLAISPGLMGWLPVTAGGGPHCPDQGPGNRS